MQYAVALAEAKRYPDALEQYRAVLNRDPEIVDAQVGLAKVASWRGDLPRALELYDAVLAKHPKNYDARVGKAFTLMWMKRGPEALKLFKALAQENPQDEEVAKAVQRLSSPQPAQ